jgi:hypothetical protein
MNLVDVCREVGVELLYLFARLRGLKDVGGGEVPHNLLNSGISFIGYFRGCTGSSLQGAGVSGQSGSET